MVSESILDTIKYERITVDAVVENLDRVIEFVENTLSKFDIPMKVITQLDVVTDELFANVSSYSYGDAVGTFTLEIGMLKDNLGIVLKSIDDGIKFDPLEKEDPDVTGSAEERAIGGLGIFMIKKFSDEISYLYKDNKNILTIIKYL